MHSNFELVHGSGEILVKYTSSVELIPARLMETVQKGNYAGVEKP
jgi:hypothetical protein